MKQVRAIGLCLVLCASALTDEVIGQQISAQQATYEVGLYLSMTGNYEAADECFRAMMKQRKRADVYHNAAINSALRALAHIPESQRLYTFPFEMGQDIPSGAPDISQSRRYLVTASQYFLESIRLDPDHPMAYVDYASVLAILKDYQQAANWAKKVNKLPQTVTGKRTALGYSLAIQAICATHVGNHTDRGLLLKQAESIGGSAIGSFLALNSLSTKTLVLGEQPSGFGIERIDGYRPIRFAQQEQRGASFSPLQLPGGPIVYLYPLNNSFLYKYLSNQRDAYYLFTTPTYPNTSYGNVRIGANTTEVRSQYGSPVTIRRHGSGQLWHYDQQGIIFQLSNQGTVSGWVTYYQN